MQFLQENMGFISLRFPIITFAQPKDWNSKLNFITNCQIWKARWKPSVWLLKQHFPVHFSYHRLMENHLTRKSLVLDQGTFSRFTSGIVTVRTDTNTLGSDSISWMGWTMSVNNQCFKDWAMRTQPDIGLTEQHFNTTTMVCNKLFILTCVCDQLVGNFKPITSRLCCIVLPPPLMVANWNVFPGTKVVH